MASSMVQFCLKSLQNAKRINYYPFFHVVRYSSKKPPQKSKRGTIKYRNIIDSCCESLAARGFLRSLKPYTPPQNVNEKISAICQKILGNDYKINSPLTRENKFALLNTCFEELNYSVPNSLLHKINNIEDVINFYQTPVSTANPYDELINSELPPNLHVLQDYVRFDPETDVKFKGITAFPRSSTIITKNSKYRNKYRGTVEKPYYIDIEAVFDKDSRFN